jgi:hypothetical protein
MRILRCLGASCEETKFEKLELLKHKKRLPKLRSQSNSKARFLHATWRGQLSNLVAKFVGCDSFGFQLGLASLDCRATAHCATKLRSQKYSARRGLSKATSIDNRKTLGTITP